MSYVYGLFDPFETNFLDSIFYIGKGSGSRMYNHLKEWKLDPDTCVNPYKVHKILKIKKCGREPFTSKIFSGLSDTEAFSLEKRMIEIIGMKNLTNIVSGGEGGHSGELSPTYGRELTVHDKEKVSKLNSDEVKEIKWLVENTEISQSLISELYSIRQTTVSNIVLEKSWTGINIPKKPGWVSDEFLSQLKKKREERLINKKESNSVLTREEVKEIKWILKNDSNISLREVADKYDVSYKPIDSIKKNRTWDYLDGFKKPKWYEDGKYYYKKEKISRSNSKLKKYEVKEIKWLLENTDLSQKDISDRYDVSNHTISSVDRRKNWSHVTEMKKPDFV